MPPEPRSLAKYRLGCDAKFPRNLPRAGTRHERHEEGQLKLRLLQPVIGTEGLSAEVALAVKAAPALDAAGEMLADKEAGPSEGPLFPVVLVIPAAFIGTERGLLGGDPKEHPLSLARLSEMQFERHNLRVAIGRSPGGP